MKPREIKYVNHGIYVNHDQPCPIYPTENAVLIIQRGYFQPSWRAQKIGYKTIKADTWLRRFILELFFKSEFRIGNEESGVIYE